MMHYLKFNHLPTSSSRYNTFFFLSLQNWTSWEHPGWHHFSVPDLHRSGWNYSQQQHILSFDERHIFKQNLHSYEQWIESK